ncbi:MAG: tRNA 2-thiouridine(34) synthase MnmA [Lachnospiraceae bacterium]|nr:tRNA 2-thiouridine(34) synthase MnmA [Lachnospiraceae bacterium]
MAKVVVGMSGGVDSAVCAYLLKEAGYEVVGLTLRTWESDDGEDSRCCEIDDAKDTANALGIEYHTLNCVDDFKKQVVNPFIDRYISGKTPNPCVSCNRIIKWDRLLYFANVVNADYVATGHYANIVKLNNGRYSVKWASHQKKDQTYMLYQLSQEQLSKTLMPLGDYTKDEIREIARKCGIKVADKPDSQEICFVTDGKYSEFIEKNSPDKIPPEGNFVDENGNIIGRHKGIINYTVGQRKGLGIAMGHPVFVKEINADTNEVVIGEEESLYSRVITCSEVNYVGIEPLKEGETVTCNTKVRYHHKAQKSFVRKIDNNSVEVQFEEPVKSAAPGQSAVFYDDNGCVLGGGIIQKGFHTD